MELFGQDSLSPQTLSGFNWALRKLEAHLGSDTPLASITATQVRDFLNSLSTLTNKSLVHVRAGMAALWTWAVDEGLAPHKVARDTKAPKPEKVSSPAQRGVVSSIPPLERSRDSVRFARQRGSSVLAARVSPELQEQRIGTSRGRVQSFGVRSGLKGHDTS